MEVWLLYSGLTTFSWTQAGVVAGHFLNDNEIVCVFCLFQPHLRMHLQSWSKPGLRRVEKRSYSCNWLLPWVERLPSRCSTSRYRAPDWHFRAVASTWFG